MGQSYRTTDPQDVDFMYKLPENLMMKVIEQADAQNDAQAAKLDAYTSGLASIKYLDSDRDRANQILNDYNGQIDQISQTINSNPQDWRKHMPAMRNLSRTLMQDYSKGELAAIQSNYSKYAELDKYIGERQKEGKLSPETARKMKARMLADFDGTNYESNGAYNQIKTEQPMDDMDLHKWASDRLSKMQADGQITYDTKMGMYKMRTEHGYEGITPDRILNTLMASAKGDSQLQEYLNQRTRYGVFDGASMLKNTMLSAVGEFSYSKTKNGLDMDTNALYNQNDQQAHALQVQANSFGHEEKMEGIKHSIHELEADNAAGRQFQMWKDEKQMSNMSEVIPTYDGTNETEVRSAIQAVNDAISKHKSGAPIEYKPFTQQKFEQAVSKLQDFANGVSSPKTAAELNSVVGVVTVNPNEKVTAQTIGQNVVNNRATLAQLLQAKAAELAAGGPIAAAKYDDQIQDIKTKLAISREWYGKATSAGVNKVGQEGYDFLRQMESGGLEQAKQRIAALKASINDSAPRGANEVSIFGTKEAKAKQETRLTQFNNYKDQLKNEENLVKKYETLQKQYNGARNEFLVNNYEHSSVKLPVVSMNATQQSSVLASIAGLENVTMVDTKTQEKITLDGNSISPENFLNSYSVVGYTGTANKQGNVGVVVKLKAEKPENEKTYVLIGSGIEKSLHDYGRANPNDIGATQIYNDLTRNDRRKLQADMMELNDWTSPDGVTMKKVIMLPTPHDVGDKMGEAKLQVTKLKSGLILGELYNNTTGKWEKIEKKKKVNGQVISEGNNGIFTSQDDLGLTIYPETTNP